MPSPPPSPPDPVLETEVERAVAPYRGVVSAEVLDQMKERLREALLFHPVARRLLNRVRPVPVLQQSDEIQGRDPGKSGGAHASSGRRKAGGDEP